METANTNNNEMTAFIKLTNSPVCIEDFEYELYMRDIGYESGNEGVYVKGEDFENAMDALRELEEQEQEDEEKHIDDLTDEELIELRKDVVLNSIFIYDFENHFGIDPYEVHDFFEGYADYLFERAAEEGFEDIDNAFNVIEAYDDDDNLIGWRTAVMAGSRN